MSFIFKYLLGDCMGTGSSNPMKFFDDNNEDENNHKTVLINENKQKKAAEKREKKKEKRNVARLKKTEKIRAMLAKNKIEQNESKKSGKKLVG